MVPHRYGGSVPRRIPADVARVLDVFRDLGDAARRGLHVAEQATRRQVESGARAAAALARRLR